jgi:hypothetical protein
MQVTESSGVSQRVLLAPVQRGELPLRGKRVHSTRKTSLPSMKNDQGLRSGSHIRATRIRPCKIWRRLVATTAP